MSSPMQERELNYIFHSMSWGDTVGRKSASAFRHHTTVHPQITTIRVNPIFWIAFIPRDVGLRYRSSNLQHQAR